MIYVKTLSAVMERSQEYDPSLASWATFLDRHIRLSIDEFFLNRRWLKNKTPESLEEINEFEPDRQPRLNDVHSWELNFQENAVFAAEVQEVIDTMPEQLRDVAEYLKHYSLAETSDLMDIPPNVLRRDIKKLKKIFWKAKIRPDHFEDF